MRQRASYKKDKGVDTFHLILKWLKKRALLKKEGAYGLMLVS